MRRSGRKSDRSKERERDAYTHTHIHRETVPCWSYFGRSTVLRTAPYVSASRKRRRFDRQPVDTTRYKIEFTLYLTTRKTSSAIAEQNLVNINLTIYVFYVLFGDINICCFVMLFFCPTTPTRAARKEWKAAAFRQLFKKS